MRWVAYACLIAWSQTAGVCPAAAAETSDTGALSKTYVVLKVDASEPVPIRTKFQDIPPAIIIEFPASRVIGSLPERSLVSKGIIQAITARYDAAGGGQQRFLRAVQIELGAAYVSNVRSEPGHVVVEITHPASTGSSASVEVGLRGGTIIEGLGQPSMSERFQAMQHALARVTPTPWTIQFNPDAPEPRATEAPASGAAAAASGSESQRAPSAAPQDGARGSARPWKKASALFIGFAALLGFAVGTAGWRLARRSGISRRVFGPVEAGGARLPSGVVLIDQLVWRAFERQGYQLVTETESPQPFSGTFRVIQKEQSKFALLFVGQAPFFEKRTVEQFVRLVAKANLEQGFLAASGSFTVPAQRTAKAHRVVLIGREQLTELLSAGAAGEYVTKQLEQQQARLEEAKETLRQYAGELDTLRRQRNEASWYLGEERERSAKLEAQLTEATQQLRHHETELQRWAQEAEALRKQWDENQWYLGEAQARIKHLEAQTTDLRAGAQRAEAAEQARDQADRYLEEERTKRAALETHLAEFEERLKASSERERTLQETLSQLQQELTAVQQYGERRAHRRVAMSEAAVELRNGSEEPVCSGSLRDLSRTGLGLESDQELPALSSVRLQVRIPGCDPIESRAQLKWQRREGEPPRYHSGYRFMRLSGAAAAAIEALLHRPQS